MSMAIFSSHPSLGVPPSHTLAKAQPSFKPYLTFTPAKRLHFHLLVSTDNGSGVAVTAPDDAAVSQEVTVGSNGSLASDSKSGFQDSRWIRGTWDLKQFGKDGRTNWDAVIDAEVKRRKWMETNPQSSSNEDPVFFDTSMIPWWAWMKRFHLPEAELLNGRAAMIGFIMAYFVDSLTGVGLVDQMGNFFCKTLLFVAVAGVLLIRKNEDVDTIKKLVEETTFYDKQWQATWQEDTQTASDKE